MTISTLRFSLCPFWNIYFYFDATQVCLIHLLGPVDDNFNLGNQDSAGFSYNDDGDLQLTFEHYDKQWNITRYINIAF